MELSSVKPFDLMNENHLFTGMEMTQVKGEEDLEYAEFLTAKKGAPELYEFVKKYMLEPDSEGDPTPSSYPTA